MEAEELLAGPPEKPLDAALDALLPPRPTNILTMDANSIRRAYRAVLDGWTRVDTIDSVIQTARDNGADPWTLAIIQQEVDRARERLIRRE